MFERRSLRWPITLGVIMIVLIVLLLVGWVLLSIFGLSFTEGFAGLYWTLLAVGAVFLVFVLVGVVMYLTLSIKAINLGRRQSNFIDSVTHELKSPIASLKLYLQTLDRHRVSPEEQVSFCKFMLEDVERLDTLINHLLDAARLDKQQPAVEPEDVELAEVLRRCADEVCLRYQVTAEVVRLDLQPCIVRSTPVDLSLIFRNLIDNAVKYAADDDPQVVVTLRAARQGTVVVRIEDNGRGISPAQRRNIFGRFVRLGSELERDKPGTGLGLYIVRTLIERLHGRIRVRDRDGGTGSVFEVELPGVAAPVADAKKEPRSPEADAA
ncbi:MAG TPA: HAMP domain-containing sensor histidine kinase [Pirellulaceae bacterium]|nr:HAMP domain-containing sensor histidine kinase [Pirellulaceae bacterium]